jgi:hypothetical protein
MIVSLAGTAGALVPSPTPEAANTSTPLALNSVSRVSADPDTVPVCTSSTVGRPATGSPGAAFSANVAVVPVLAGAVNDVHLPASGVSPATNAVAAEAVENW